MENKEFLTEQIITYLGNKRSLLNFIDNVIEIVKQELKKDKLSTFDVFSGSGIVSRYLKQHSKVLYCLRGRLPLLPDRQGIPLS